MDTGLTLFIVILLILIISNGILAYFIFKGKRGNAKEEGQGMTLLLNQLNELNRIVDSKIGDLGKTVDMRMNESSKQMNESVRAQFSESAKLIRDVTLGLTKLDETNKQVISFADQLQSLQDVLKNPKQRGVLGEYYLETLLKNTLPPGSYEMQYKMTDTDIVDAAVFVKDKIIPVDSKFSLENYNRLVEAKSPSEKDRLEKVFVNDLKQRIQETAKYIQPAIRTTEFAFMFIPHEAIYYDLLINKIGTLGEDSENLIQRAAGKYKVIIVSPTSFLAYLQTVLQGLRALEIEETAKDIIKRVGELSRHLKSYQDYYAKLGNSLSTTVGHYNSAGKEFKKIDKDVTRIAGTAVGVDVIALEKPEREQS